MYKVLNEICMKLKYIGSLSFLYLIFSGSSFVIRMSFSQARWIQIYCSMQCMYKPICLPYSLISGSLPRSIFFQSSHASSLVSLGRASLSLCIPGFYRKQSKSVTAISTKNTFYGLYWIFTFLLESWLGPKKQGVGPKINCSQNPSVDHWAWF